MMIERTAKYADLALDENCTRALVVKTLGEPESVHSYDIGRTETYSVEGRVFDSGNYWGTVAGWRMTLGLHELILFPWQCWRVVSEAIYPTKRKLEILYYDDKCNQFHAIPSL